MAYSKIRFTGRLAAADICMSCAEFSAPSGKSSASFGDVRVIYADFQEEDA